MSQIKLLFKTRVKIKDVISWLAALAVATILISVMNGCEKVYLVT